MATICYGLTGKVFVVTGGSRGIGLELARRLLKEGAKVVICARKQEGLDEASRELQGGDSLLAVPAHIARENDVDLLFEQTRARFSKVDILINNVGMNLMTPSLVDTEAATWQKIIESNLSGTYYCSRAAARMMRETGGGKIVNISSTAACRPAPGMGIYGIAKAGIEMMTKVLAAELASDNIQVNAVAPCMVKTGFSAPFWSNQDVHDQIIRTIPMGRLAETADVVEPVLFLCSDGADFITGQVLAVDGGSTVT
jgi:NAD(P)-dependent dehydrogenase (short-subunit alcohol dehydrogenase family)